MSKDYCVIKGLKQIYKVEKIINDDIYLSFKNLNVKTKIQNIEYVERPAEIQNKCESVLYTKDIPNEIMLRHKTKEEAIQDLDKYIDQAIICKLGRIRIIHGRHGGIIKKAVREYLDNHPYVKEYSYDDYSKGGIGVTVAILGAKK